MPLKRLAGQFFYLFCLLVSFSPNEDFPKTLIRFAGFLLLQFSSSIFTSVCFASFSLPPSLFTLERYTLSFALFLSPFIPSPLHFIRNFAPSSRILVYFSDTPLLPSFAFYFTIFLRHSSFLRLLRSIPSFVTLLFTRSRPSSSSLLSETHSRRPLHIFSS